MRILLAGWQRLGELRRGPAGSLRAEAAVWHSGCLLPVEQRVRTSPALVGRSEMGNSGSDGSSEAVFKWNECSEDQRSARR